MSEAAVQPPPARATEAPVVTEADRAAFVAAAAAAEYAVVAALTAEFLGRTVGTVRAVAEPQPDATIALQPIGGPIEPDTADALRTAAVAALLSSNGTAARRNYFAVRPLNRRRGRLPGEVFVGEIIRPDVDPSADLILAAGCLSTALMKPAESTPRGGDPLASLTIDLADAALAAGPQSEPLLKVAERLQERFGGRVVVLDCHRTAAPSKWVAASPAVPPSEELEAAVEAAADEVRASGGPVSWPPDTSLDRPARKAVERAHELLAPDAASATLTLIPVESTDGTTECVCILSDADLSGVGDSQSAAADRLRAALTPTLGLALRSRREASEGPLRRMQRTAADALSGRAAHAAICIGVAVACLLASPWTYVAEAECVLEPAARRFVPAPFDGTLDTVDAKPGDLVVAGQRLATIDARENDWERAGLKAELAQAVKRRDAALAAGSLAEAQAAGFEAERLTARRDLLADRAARLDIRAPIDGIVVSGDLDRSRGVPVETGRTLFEVAPLDTLLCEVEVPEYDFAQVRKGQPAVVTLDAFPSAEFEATVLRVRPRAETRDSGVVFVAEVEISDPNGRLRPGMTGSADISTDKHPLAWNLFHRAAGRWRRGW